MNEQCKLNYLTVAFKRAVAVTVIRRDLSCLDTQIVGNYLCRHLLKLFLLGNKGGGAVF